MTSGEIFFFIFAVLGGLALFLFGMGIMSEGLRLTAANRLRTILSRTGSNRFMGYAVGSGLGFLVHSSATTVMLVGFVNAGLKTLPATIAPMLGCNLGTTISMQIISLKLDEYCFVAIALGFFIQMIMPDQKAKSVGRSIMGFGLLFLGMKTMSGALRPHQATLSPWLSRIDGSTLPGMLLGVLASTAITGIIQSSGATIGMCYALISAGVFTSLNQVYPIVLGAHIGTCATAMLASIGTDIEARRTAIAHLLFNILNVIFAILAAPIFLRLIPLTSSDLIHQTANLHTVVMLIATLAVLPVTRTYARLVTLVVPTRKEPPQPSYLDDRLIAQPEKAISAAIQELRRVAMICARSLRVNAEIFFNREKKKIREIRLNERAIDDIKVAMTDYLKAVTARYLSHRQALMIQHISICMSNIERIGDHIDRMCDLTEERSGIPEARFDRESLDVLFHLYDAACRVLNLVIDSLNPKLKDFQQMAKRILDTRNEYAETSMDAKKFLSEHMTEKGVGMAPLAGMYFNMYITTLDRIVRHSKTIAILEQRPEFWIKRKKLKHIVEEAEYNVPGKVEPNDYLQRLHSEDYS